MEEAEISEKDERKRVVGIREDRRQCYTSTTTTSPRGTNQVEKEAGIEHTE